VLKKLSGAMGGVFDFEVRGRQLAKACSQGGATCWGGGGVRSAILLSGVLALLASLLSFGCALAAA
jgi:hypothetical protein